jgi:hypothetical protein
MRPVYRHFKSSLLLIYKNITFIGHSFMNTLVINRPNSEGMNSMSCSSSCSPSSGKGGCRPGIGPRKQREKVRESIREYIIFMLGGPTLPLEIDEQAIDFCINQSLKIVEDYAPREYFTYYTFPTIPGKSVYEMPPDVGYVRSVEYKNFGQFAFNASELGGQIPLEYFYSGSSISDGLINPVQPIWGKAGEWVLYKQYETMYSKVSSALGGWEWIGGYRNIKLYPTPGCTTKVAVQYLQKCKDWEEVTQAMNEGALSFAKEILGRIRSRIKNPPGPGGGLQLDGDQLLQEAKEERKQWMEDLIYKFGDPLGITFG